MIRADELHGRQIWAMPTSTSSSLRRHCNPFILPSKGILTIDSTSIITLSQDAVFQPECTTPPSLPPDATSSETAIFHARDPFYTSISPQMYATATTTVVSYMLVIMLFITPRTFFIGGVGGGSRFLGRRGLISGASGSASVVGVGGRPWLQKVATLTVAISLTIATVDTFKVAEAQYHKGYQDATALTDRVVGGLEIRVIRIISDTFLWLAQVQTLIRLFPRHKEKVMIKWIGFALIILDTLFSILNTFVGDHGRVRPRRFVNAIPALSYLFELALSLLYAAWIIYYSLEKRRFAFFHPKMRNICLVAILSLSAVLVPVTFFVLDISKPDIARWGDYVRWVGAAAASVVVWEWVERIEALERDERKEGILGREIFDGDEMLDVTPSSEGNWPRNLRDPRRSSGGDRHINTTGRSGVNKTIGTAEQTARSRVPPSYVKYARRKNGGIGPLDRGAIISGAVDPRTLSPQNHPTPPLPVASPTSRSDTTSAASTVYAVHYHTISTSTSPGPDLSSTRSRRYMNGGSSSTPTPPAAPLIAHATTNGTIEQHSTSNMPPVPSNIESGPRWQNLVHNPFKRRRTSPPPEVAHATRRLANNSSPTVARHKHSVRNSSMADRLRVKRRPRAPDVALPVVTIPAQPRGKTYKPPDLSTGTAQVTQSDGNAVGDTPRELNEDSEQAPSSSQQRPSPFLELPNNESITTQLRDQMVPGVCQPHDSVPGTATVHRPLGSDVPPAPVPADSSPGATDEFTTRLAREASDHPESEHAYPVQPLQREPSTDTALESRKPP